MTDYNFLMESRLSPQQHHVLTSLSRIAAEEGMNLYLAGGAVRDLTFGQQVVCTLDFVVEGNPRKILRHLAPTHSSKPRVAASRVSTSELRPPEVEYMRYDPQLNLVELRFRNGVRAELAMGRQETYTKPGRRPEVSPAMIFDDLKRRDFSVNAMAISLHPNSRGLLLDPTNGVADIEKHELRVLRPRAFTEDPSRIYRLLRLAIQMNFKPEERTKTLLEAALENRVWERVDPKQQGRELRAILERPAPRRILKALAKQGLLAGLDQKLAAARIPYDRFAKIRSVVESVPGSDPLLLNFHCLVEKMGQGQKERLAKKILGDPKTVKMALGLERDARKLARVLVSSKASLPRQAYTLLAGQPQPLLLYLLVHYPQKKIQSRVKNFLFKYLPLRARLPRAELQAIGMKAGPEFEKILQRVFLDQLDGNIKTHQQLMKQLRALAGIPEAPPKPPAAAPPKPKGKKKR